MCVYYSVFLSCPLLWPLFFFPLRRLLPSDLVQGKGKAKSVFLDLAFSLFSLLLLLPLYGVSGHGQVAPFKRREECRRYSGDLHDEDDKADSASLSG